MNLRTLFAIPVTVILLVTLSLAGMITSHGFSGHARGRAVIAAVERTRLLVLLQTGLWAERVASNAALGERSPLPDPQARALAVARRDTDRWLEALTGDFADGGDANTASPPLFLPEIVDKLRAARFTIDTLLAAQRSDRTFQDIAAAMTRVFAAAAVLDRPLAAASLDITAAEPSLSSLMTVARLSTMLKDGLGRIPRLMLPRFSTGQRMTTADAEAVHVLLAQQTQLTLLLADTFESAGPSDQMRASLASLRQIDDTGMRQQLNDLVEGAQLDAYGEAGIIWMQRLIVPWSEQVNALRLAIMDAAVERATLDQAARVNQLNIVLAAFGAVVVAILESIALLHWRVVGPLAQLGLAITRIAAGDRATPLVMKSGTSELAGMVTAVETLRRAALIADAAAMRQREVAERRLHALHDVLGILQTVQEPAHALERSVASLSEGIDAAIALVTTPTCLPPATLGAAASAVRAGMEVMRDATADLDATMAAARAAQTDERPEAEIVAYILAVQRHVDRRDAAVRGFIQPSLVALRDAASAGGTAPVLRDLVRVQFHRIEATVAMVASMRASVARAATIVDDLPLEETPLAA
jgi:hypothetical protein